MTLYNDMERLLQTSKKCAQKYTDDEIAKLGDIATETYVQNAIKEDNLAEQVWLSAIEKEEDLDLIDVEDQGVAYLVLVQENATIYQRIPDKDAEWEVYFVLPDTIDIPAVIQEIETLIGEHDEDSASHADIRTLITTNDALYVKLAGAQTITGDKTFSGDVNVKAPTANANASTKKYVDDKFEAIDVSGDITQHDEDVTAHGDIRTEITTKDGQNVKLTGAQSVAGVKTFTSSPIVPTGASGTQAICASDVATKIGDALTEGLNPEVIEQIITNFLEESGEEVIGALIDGKIDDHDIEPTAHADIRQLITDLTNGVVKTTGAQSVAGVKTFTSEPIVPTPTANGSVANKKYVDDGDIETLNQVSVAINNACDQFMIDEDLV